MPKKKRLSRADMQSLHGGKNFRTYGKLFILTSAPAETSRFACAVSKKVSNKAVIRNLIKRRVRTALRSLAAKELPAGSYAFHAKGPAANASSEEISADIGALLFAVAQKG